MLFDQIACLFSGTATIPKSAASNIFRAICFQSPSSVESIVIVFPQHILFRKHESPLTQPQYECQLYPN